jgi:hypothetical protein
MFKAVFRNKTVKRILEIGIGYKDLMEPFVPQYIHGASLRMWRDYFPDAEIYACDILPETLINDGRIHSIEVDQSKASDLEKLLPWGPFDVIIDDGSHLPLHQIFTAKFLLPHLSRGGMYVIEDCRDPERVISSLGAGVIIRGNKRPDDNLVVMISL